jgi:protein-tyrosine-phosphatase
MANPAAAVLFACGWNAIRSPMAEALLKHYHGRSIYVDSVGVRALEVDGFAVAALMEMGLDISTHRTKTFDQLEDTSFDLVVTLSPEAQHRAMELTRTMSCEVEYWQTFDPTVIEGSREVRLDAYRELRQYLIRRVLERFPLAPGPSV